MHVIAATNRVSPRLDMKRISFPRLVVYPEFDNRPEVGLNPTTPHSAAGILTDPGQFFFQVKRQPPVHFRKVVMRK